MVITHNNSIQTIWVFCCSLFKWTIECIYQKVAALMLLRMTGKILKSKFNSTYDNDEKLMIDKREWKQWRNFIGYWFGIFIKTDLAYIWICYKIHQSIYLFQYSNCKLYHFLNFLFVLILHPVKKNMTSAFTCFEQVFEIILYLNFNAFIP